MRKKCRPHSLAPARSGRRRPGLRGARPQDRLPRRADEAEVRQHRQRVRGATRSRRPPALPYGADRRLGSGHGTAGDDVTVQDIDGLARYWESELALAGSRETRVPTIASPIGRTWIWSDLHPGDRGPLEAFDRPFADVPAMNRHLLARWCRRVQPGDTIICLGDVAHPDAWRDRRLVLDLRACPGERILILGDHDTDLRALAEAGFATQHRQALSEAEPTLALSHEPPLPHNSCYPRRGDLDRQVRTRRRPCPSHASLRLCSPPSRRIATLCPRSAGLTALTAAPRRRAPIPGRQGLNMTSTSGSLPLPAEYHRYDPLEAAG